LSSNQSTGNSLNSFTDVHALAVAAMLIALNIVLTRYFSIQTQFLRIGFGFMPVAVFSMLYGAIPGGIAAVGGDLIGFFLFPTGPFFPGITFSAFVLGAIYGLFLHKKELSLWRVIVCCVCAVFVVDAFLNTIWLSMLYSKAISLIVVSRLIKAAVMLPIEVALIYAFYRIAGKRMQAAL
jgi:ECF transporter S component (folate family)